jgi:hypothetical protein
MVNDFWYGRSRRIVAGHAKTQRGIAKSLPVHASVAARRPGLFIPNADYLCCPAAGDSVQSRGLLRSCIGCGYASLSTAGFADLSLT